MRTRVLRWGLLAMLCDGFLLAACSGTISVQAPRLTVNVTAPSVAGSDIFNDVACVTIRNCVMVGSSGGTGAVASASDGIASAVQDESAAGPFVAVACRAPGTCIAVGSHFIQGAVMTINDGKPSPVRTVAGTGGIDDIACPTSSCVAVGTTYVTARHSTSFGSVMQIRRGVVSHLRKVAVASGLGSISCPSSDTCEALGTQSMKRSIVDSQIRTIVVSLTHGIPGQTSVIPGNFIPWGIACSDQSSCEAVGWRDRPRSVNTFSEGLVVTITNGIPGAIHTMRMAPLGSPAPPRSRV